jgi:hypothetical protein
MSSPTSRRVVIVDAMAPGRALLRQLLERNVECLHLRSCEDLAAIDLDTRDFDGDLGFVGDVSEAIHLLAELAPSAVVAGSAYAAGYAEAVADGLGLPTHAIERFNARRQAESLLQCARPDAGPVLVQPAAFAAAPQFIVNTVSFARLHCVTDAWRLTDLQIGEAAAPGALELCDPAASAVMFDHVRGVLDQLGLRFGPAHVQVAMTEEGPRLVGASSTLMELAISEASLAAAGLQSQASAWAECLTSDPPHRAALQRPAAFERLRPMAIVLFRFGAPADVVCVAGLGRLKSLPSFRAHETPLTLGETVWPRSTWLAQGGLVHLVSDSAAQIAADIRQFRAWEAEGQLYGLAPLDTAPPHQTPTRLP